MNHYQLEDCTCAEGVPSGLHMEEVLKDDDPFLTLFEKPGNTSKIINISVPFPSLNSLNFVVCI